MVVNVQGVVGAALLVLVAFHAPFARTLVSAPAAGAVVPVGSSSLLAIRERYFHLLESSITGMTTDELGTCNGGPGGCALSHLAPFDYEARRKGGEWPPAGHTMIGILRMRNIRMAIETVIAEGIPGDFIELGVWRGGACIYAKALIDALDPHSERAVVLMDVFGEIANYGHAASFLAVPEAQVRANFVKYLGPDALKGVVFVKGLFKVSVRRWRAPPAAAFACVNDCGAPLRHRTRSNRTLQSAMALPLLSSA